MDLQEEFEDIGAMLTAYNEMSLSLLDNDGVNDETSYGMTLIHQLIMAQLDEVAAAAMSGAGVINPRSDAGRTLKLRERLVARGVELEASAADLSQALNIRKASVERIIARLTGAEAQGRKAV